MINCRWMILIAWCNVATVQGQQCAVVVPSRTTTPIEKIDSEYVLSHEEQMAAKKAQELSEFLLGLHQKDCAKLNEPVTEKSQKECAQLIDEFIPEMQRAWQLRSKFLEDNLFVYRTLFVTSVGLELWGGKKNSLSALLMRHADAVFETTEALYNPRSRPVSR